MIKRSWESDTQRFFQKVEQNLNLLKKTENKRKHHERNHRADIHI